jgi:hypothetical protein
MAQIRKATLTLKAIDDAIAADQGGAWRQHLQKVLPAMGDAYRGKEDNPFRTHLGASVIGGGCARAIWYGFHWATRPTFSGRILRLFNRGHLEEARVISALLTIGVQIFQQDENGNQFRISDVGGHFGGSGDGVAVGIPDLPQGMPCLLEFKTHNDASFKKLQKVGVREAKFEHFVQMQVYMRKMGLTVALYGSVNKNDDDYYMEIIELDTSVGDQFIDRGRQIILMNQAPAKISESPGWFDCKWCDHKPVCHLKVAPERNCRTCKHSEANEDGNWYCNVPSMPDDGGLSRVDAPLTKEEQFAACPEYAQF